MRNTRRNMGRMKKELVERKAFTEKEDEKCHFQ